MKAQNAGTVRSRTRKLFQLGTRPNDPFSDIAYVAIFRLEMTKLHSVFGGKSLHPKYGLNWGKSRCLKITEKVSFNIASEASYVSILSGQKLMDNFGEFL